MRARNVGAAPRIAAIRRSACSLLGMQCWQRNGERIKLSTLTPEWGHAMTVPGAPTRINVNAVLLPDGSVFVVGGTSDRAAPCARYDADSGAWRTMARANYRKQYHSVAVLLPSGKVLATGGSNYGGGSNVIEVFSPPYLLTKFGAAAARPVIANAPGSMSVGGSVDIYTVPTPHRSRAWCSCGRWP